ncbi:hypothetical protein A2U01_0040232, partial [Trifolium medium]|nr:hypothetical protein [Trifolium medium]
VCNCEGGPLATTELHN